MITIDLYNILLHGFAENGSFEHFHDIFRLIEEDGLNFNYQTFAAIFECLGRLESSPENTDLIQKYIDESIEFGYSLNEIMDKSKFLADQRDVALHAIQRALPDFKPLYSPPILGYNNPLLNHLNEKILSPHEDVNHANKCSSKVDGSEIMHSKLGYNKAQLEELAREQLKIELDGCITIKSIEKSKEFSNVEYCVSYYII